MERSLEGDKDKISIKTQQQPKQHVWGKLMEHHIHLLLKAWTWKVNVWKYLRAQKKYIPRLK